MKYFIKMDINSQLKEYHDCLNYCKGAEDVINGKATPEEVAKNNPFIQDMKRILEEKGVI